MKKALFSTPAHAELENLARRLIACGWHILGTPEVCAALSRAGLEHTALEHFTGEAYPYSFPPTLHPKVEAALTQDGPDRIDLVYDLPYGPEKGEDVGGLTLLALAAKGKRIALRRPEDLDRLLTRWEQNNPPVEREMERMRSEIFSFIARRYDGWAGRKTPLSGALHRPLAEGENPYQKPSFLFRDDSGDPLSIASFAQAAGPAPCFTNTADLDSLLNTLAKLCATRRAHGLSHTAVAVAGKHGNPCGVGVREPGRNIEAIGAALWGNPTAVWGGELIVTFPLGCDEALAIRESAERGARLGAPAWMLDWIAAPEASSEAIAVLSGNPRRKIFTNPALASPAPSHADTVRPVRGGWLAQPAADYVLKFDGLRFPGKGFEGIDFMDLCVAWAAAYTASAGGNEVAIARGGNLIGLGGGPSTVEAVEHALAAARRASHEIAGSFFCANAFFPFTDAPDLLIQAGVSGGLVPAGGKRETEVIESFTRNGCKLGLIPSACRGFSRH